MAIAARTQAGPTDDPSPEDLHCLALVHLVLHGPDRAIPLFERALRLSPEAPELKSDLAAALLERGREQDGSVDLVRATELAHEAVETAESRTEPLFNLALAQEALALREAAQRQWSAYLTADTSSPWAREARDHLHRLESRQSRAAWASVRRELAGADAKTIEEIVTRFPQESSELLRYEWLPAWGDAWIRGDHALAVDWLRASEAVASSLSAIVGDTCEEQGIIAVQSAISDVQVAKKLAEGHVSLGRGRDALERSDLDTARTSFLQAERQLRAGHSPLALWASYHLATVDFYLQDAGARGRAVARLRSALQEPAWRGCPVLHARMFQLLGLIHTARAELEQGLRSYREASKRLQVVHSPGDKAYLGTLLAEVLDSFGDLREGWNERIRALRGMERVSHPRRRRGMLLDSAYAAFTQGFPRTALDFADASLAEARAWGDPTAIGYGLVDRAQILHDLGRLAAALGDLQRAAEVSRRIFSKPLKHRLEMELAAARGRIRARVEPREAAEELSRTLEYVSSTGMDLLVPRLHLDRGRAWLAARELEAASADLHAALEFYRSGRQKIGDDRHKITYFDLAREIVDELVSFQVTHGQRPDLALDYADLGRGPLLVERRTGAPASSLRPCRPGSIPTRRCCCTRPCRIGCWSGS